MQSTLRIPRVASAVLVLGAACGDDEKSSDVDVSESRKSATIKQLCSQAQQCDLTSASMSECESDYAAYIEEYASAGDDCVDALLDYYDCYAALDCDTVQDEDKLDEAGPKCARDAKVAQRCEGAFDDE